MTDLPINQIISGGQAGADRAALDWALDHGVPHGGWCPRGRRAEDGPIHPRYRLRETAGAAWAERTRRNVEDGDATLIVNLGALEGGTLLTLDLARALGRPHLVLALDGGVTSDILRRARAWLTTVRAGVLNLAGPRESQRPGIYVLTRQLLDALPGDAADADAPGAAHRP